MDDSTGESDADATADSGALEKSRAYAAILEEVYT
jgi:hypothetical protein